MLIASSLVCIKAPVPNPVDCGSGRLACSNYSDHDFLLERNFGDPPLEGVICFRVWDEMVELLLNILFF